MIAKGFNNLIIQSTVIETGYIIKLRDLLYALIIMSDPILSSRAQRSRIKIDIDDSDHGPCTEIMRIIAKSNGSV